MSLWSDLIGTQYAHDLAGRQPERSSPPYLPGPASGPWIQAFGGAKWAKYGWPRLPSYMEMRCLTYLGG